MKFKKLLAAVCSFLLAASSFITKSQVSARGESFPTCINNYQNIVVFSIGQGLAYNLISSIVYMMKASDRFDVFNAGDKNGGCTGSLKTDLPYYDKKHGRAFQVVMHGISDITENNCLQLAEDVNRQILSKPDVVIIHLERFNASDSFSNRSDDEPDPNYTLQGQYDMYMRFMDAAGWNRDNIYVICGDSFEFKDRLDTITDEKIREKRRRYATKLLNDFKERHEGWLKTLGYPYLLFANEYCDVMQPSGYGGEEFDASRGLHTVKGDPEGINALMDFIDEKLTMYATPIMRESNERFRQFFFVDPDEIISDVKPEEEPKEEERKEEEAARKAKEEEAARKAKEEAARKAKEEEEEKKEESSSSSESSSDESGSESSSDESGSESSSSSEEEPKEEERKEEAARKAKEEEAEPESKEEKFKNRKKSGWSTGKKAAVGAGVGAAGLGTGILATIFGYDHHKNKNKTKVPKAQKTQPKKTKVATVA